MTLELLQQSREKKARSKIKPVPKKAQDPGSGPHIFLCAICRARITSSRDQMEMSGSHFHSFANPAGIVYGIRCFSAAPGCAAIGPRTFDFTWFSGYAWQMALCRECGQHLGWKYLSDSGETFFGLIAETLIEERPETH